MSEKSLNDILKDLAGGGKKSSSNNFPKIKTTNVNENAIPELKLKLEYSERYNKKDDTK